MIEVIGKVLEDQKDIYVACADEKDQNSKRVSALQARRKLPHALQGLIGVTKHEQEGKLYVKVFYQENTLFTEQDGELVPLEDKRIEELKQKDGVEE